MPSLRSGLPPESLVFVEAYRQTVWMRFAWGTVGALQAPADRTLAEFDSTEDILFRVRVTSLGTPEEPHGLLLAEADRICLRGPEETEENRDTIFPVVPTELGDELWKVSFENERPRLLVNLRAAGNYKQFTLHPAFIALVYPAAMREVLWRIVHVEDTATMMTRRTTTRAGCVSPSRCSASASRRRPRMAWTTRMMSESGSPMRSRRSRGSTGCSGNSRRSSRRARHESASAE